MFGTLDNVSTSQVTRLWVDPFGSLGINTLLAILTVNDDAHDARTLKVLAHDAT